MHVYRTDYSDKLYVWYLAGAVEYGHYRVIGALRRERFWYFGDGESYGDGKGGHTLFRNSTTGKGYVY
jgi:hypothetical protein